MNDAVCVDCGDSFPAPFDWDGLWRCYPCGWGSE